MNYSYLAPLALVSCVATQELTFDGSVESIALSVLGRHDAYFASDEAALADSAMVRLLIPSADVIPFLLPCLDRHDAAVRADESLDALARDTYLASSARLREYIAS
jgi:hypothetical protein